MIENSPEVDSYFALVEELDKLQALQQDAVEAIRPTIDAAIDTANVRVEELRATAAVGDYLFQTATQAQQALSQIEALQSSVDLGLIPQEVLDAQKHDVLSDPRVSHAIEYIGKLGIVGEVVTVEPVVTETEADGSVQQPEVAEVERKFPDVKITVRGDGVQIGGKGKFVKLSKAYAKGQKDYSQERLAILKVLVEHAGEEVAVRDLWDQALPGVEFDRESMRQVRLWLDNLTYRRAPIVSHNGGRANSAYGIENPNVTIEEVYRTEPTQRKAPEQEEIQTPQVIEQPSELSESVDLSEAIGEESEIPVKTIEKPKKQVLFPLSHVESVILAEFLTLNKELLEKLEMPVPPDHIADHLQGTIKQPSRYMIELHQYGDLTEARRAILNKVISYFAPENDDQIFDDLVNMEELDNRYELFEYLFEFEQEQREFLLERLVDSLPVTIVTEAGGSFSSGVTVVDIQTFRVDGSGQRIDQVVKEAEVATVDVASSGQFEADFSVDDSIGTDSRTEEGVSIDVVDSGMDDSQQASDEESEARDDDADQHELENWLEDIATQAKEVIEQFEADGLMVEGSKIERRLVFTKSFSRLAGTETMMERAVSNGIIKRNQINQPLSIDKFICMMLQNSNPQAFSHKRRMKQATALVESLVLDYFEARRSQS